MLPFITLDRDAQTQATTDALTEIRVLLHITDDLNHDEIIARVGDLTNFLEDSLLLGDPTIIDARTIMGNLHNRVLPTWLLGTDLTTFRTSLRLFLTRRRPFTYGFDQQLIDTITLATFLPALPTGYIDSLHLSTHHGRDERSEYLYESAQHVHTLLTHMRDQGACNF